MYHSSTCHSEPYHQNQNPSEWNPQGIDQHHHPQGWSTCQLLVALHGLCVLPTQSHSCESLKGQIILTKLYGVTPDIASL